MNRLNPRTYKLSELADVVGGAVTGDEATVISGVAGIREAGDGDITFLANPKYAGFLESTKASAIIGPPGLECPVPSIQLEEPYLGFLRVVTLFAKDRELIHPKGVHATAIVEPETVVGEDASIGPYCHINRHARIGRGTIVLLGCYIGEDAVVGENCLIYPNVVIRERCEIGSRVIIHPGAVVGSDGFGFAQDGKIHRKIPQIGKVVVEDDVEIGSNSTIDRATTGVTRICQGTKIDNLVQIAHNVVVGKNSLLAAQAGVSGSSELGENVVMAGQSGCVGHIKIGNGVVVAAQSGVSKSIDGPMTVSGWPAREHSQTKKLHAYTRRLPELYKKVQELEKRIENLVKGKSDDQTTNDDR